MREYRYEEGSVHEQFLNSTAKMQIFGGGFGNGKTAASCIKAIRLIRDYPGCNGLIARATFPKLNDTIRKEFQAWCPPSLISSFPTSKNSDNTAKFTNGSAINFRYIAQQGKAMEQSTSNLLSATYDFAIIDQMEDPEITEKDFYDILGRLRGNTVYRGTDPRMPKSGPRWLIMTVNPTANWFYKRIIRPLQIYKQTGRITDDLLCERDEATGAPILVDGKPIMLVEVFEAPTYANKRNLGADFIKTLESTYKGQMKDRFLMGKWASYEGLVYPEFSDTVHMVPDGDMRALLDNLIANKWDIPFVEAYDFGIATPSCYQCAFVDGMGAVHIVDGFYEKEMSIADQCREIKRIRAQFGIPDGQYIYGDPSIFTRRSNTAKTVGKSTSELFYEEGKINFTRGNNDIMNGIIKVQAYMGVMGGVVHPYTGDSFSPMLFVSDKLQWFSDEATAYMWMKAPDGTPLDKPVDKNDHAMDTVKYLLTDRPEIGRLRFDQTKIPSYMSWIERDINVQPRYARYGT